MSKHWTHKLQAWYFGGLVENGRRYATFTDWWRATDRSYYMLEMLAQMEYCDDRRIRLIACRFVREVKVDKDRTEWELLTDERCRNAVVVAERYTKGEVSSKELAESRRAAWNAVLTMKEGEAQNAAWGAVITASKAETLLTLLAASHGDDSQQHANIIREVIPAEEVAPLFERWAGCGSEPGEQVAFNEQKLSNSWQCIGDLPGGVPVYIIRIDVRLASRKASPTTRKR